MQAKFTIPFPFESMKKRSKGRKKTKSVQKFRENAGKISKV
jgi:hypothetical protein